MRTLAVLMIIGVLTAVSAAAFFFVVKPVLLKSWRSWEVEVEPSDEIVIKGVVGKVKTRPVWLTCVSGENVSVSLLVEGLTDAGVKPKLLVLDEGDRVKAVLRVKIVKVGKEEGRLKVVYGAKHKEVKIKVIGFPQPTGGETGETGQPDGGQQGGEAVSSSTSFRVEWLNFTIVASVTVKGSVSGYLGQPSVTYESSFTTTYSYTWVVHLCEGKPVEGGTLYNGYIELVSVDRACTEKYYHQLTVGEGGKAEVTVNMKGCISRMPESQSLGTSVIALIDSEGRLVMLDYGYPEWYLGDISGTEVSVVQTPERTFSGTTTVTRGFYLSGQPIEFLVEVLKPKVEGDTVTGSTEIHASDYPPLAQFYVYDPKDDPVIEITATIITLPGEV